MLRILILILALVSNRAFCDGLTIQSLQHARSSVGASYHITVTSTSNADNDPFTILALTNPEDSGVNLYIGILNFTIKTGQAEIRTWVGNVSIPSNMLAKTPRSTNTNFASNVGEATAMVNNAGSSGIIQQGLLAVASFIAAGPHIFPDLKDVFTIGPGARVDFQVQTTTPLSAFNMYLQWSEVSL